MCTRNMRVRRNKSFSYSKEYSRHTDIQHVTISLGLAESILKDSRYYWCGKGHNSLVTTETPCIKRSEFSLLKVSYMGHILQGSPKS